MIGEDRLIHFSGVAKAEACTIVLRGASEPSCPCQLLSNQTAQYRQHLSAACQRVLVGLGTGTGLCHPGFGDLLIAGPCSML